MAKSRGITVLVLWPVVAVATPGFAQSVDQLQGKFTFDWHSEPARQTCRKVEGPLLAGFKSANYRCDLKPVTNTASGKPAVICSQVKGGKREYMVFDTKRNCEDERKTQASNG
jgi:hypothetical protein